MHRFLTDSTNQKSQTQKSILPSGVRAADLVLFFGGILSAVLLAVLLAVCSHQGTSLQVSADGKLLYEYALETGKENTIYLLITSADEASKPEVVCSAVQPKLPDSGCYNLLEITGSTVRMTAASCPDQICVRHRAISGTMESIVCLPNKLTIQMIGGAAQETDALDGMVH